MLKATFFDEKSILIIFINEISINDEILIDKKILINKKFR